MTQMITPKYHSTTYDSAKLSAVTELLIDDLDSLLETLGVDLSDSRHMIYGPCPVHGGDRFNACHIYRNSGVWLCETKHCETTFKKTIIGFIRGVLSRNKYGWEKEGDRTVSFNDALQWALRYLNKTLDNVEVDRDAFEKKQFVRQAHIISKEQVVNKNVITKETIRKSLNIPSPYYQNRGYSKEILERFDIGECKDTSKEMRYRVVVPIYDENGDYVGCSGRSTFEKCPKCHLHHHENSPCPAKEKEMLYAKWRHSGFNANSVLYNYHGARLYLDSGCMIITESPGNVWRLVENGIQNCVATFGASLSDGQKCLLDESGAMSLIVIMDNDEAGTKLLDSVNELCGRTYRIYGLRPTKNDVGEMSKDEITEEIKPLINSIKGVI